MPSTPQGLPSDKPVDPGVQYLGDALRTSFSILKFIMLIVLAIFLCSGMFVVGQHEVGLVLRFGAFQGTKLDRVRKPGLHWAFPYPIDRVVKVPVARVLDLNVWAFWPQAGRNQRLQGEKAKLPKAPLKPGQDGYNITADRNLVHTMWTVRYKIDDPVAYVANLADPAELDSEVNARKTERLISVMLQNAAIRVMGRFSVDDALRDKKQQLTADVSAALARAIDSLDVGIATQQVLMGRPVQPPGRVVDAFDSVNKTGQQMSKLIEGAKGYEASLLEEASGEASAIKSEAEAYRTLIVEKAESDANYMQALLKECQGNPEKLQLFLRRQQIDAAQEFIAAASEKFILRPKQADATRELRLLLNRDPEAAKQLYKAKQKAKKASKEGG